MCEHRGFDIHSCWGEHVNKVQYHVSLCYLFYDFYVHNVHTFTPTYTGTLLGGVNVG